MAEKIQTRTISHTGSELGAEYVSLLSNQISPQRESAVISFEVPRKYESLTFDGEAHSTKFVPRTMESVDSDGTTTVPVSSKIQPVAGEEDVEDQVYPVAVVVDTTAGAQIDVVSADYAANTVELESAPASGNVLKVYPILAEGTVKMQGVNQFGQVEGAVNKWSLPIYRFHDFNQDEAGFEINLQGRVNWGRNETLEILVDSPHQVVWEDADYPDAFVSTLEQRVNIEL